VGDFYAGFLAGFPTRGLSLRRTKRTERKRIRKLTRNPGKKNPEEN